MPENAWVVVFIAGLIAVAIAYRMLWVRALSIVCSRHQWQRASAEEHDELEEARGAGGIQDAVRGTHQGVRFLVGTREWTTGTGKSRSTHHERLAMFDLSAAAPELTAEHTGRLREALSGVFGGGEDVDIPEDPAFSSRWRITAPDPAAARAILTRGVRAALAEVEGVTRVSGSRVAWWESGRTYWPTQYPGMVRNAARVHRAVEDTLAELRMSPEGIPSSPPPPSDDEGETPVAIGPADIVLARIAPHMGRIATGAVGAGLALFGFPVTAVGGYAMVNALSRGTGDEGWWTQTLIVTGVALAAFVAGVVLLWGSRRR